MKPIYILMFIFLNINISAQNTAFDRNDSNIVNSFEPKLIAFFIDPDARINQKCYTKKWSKATILLYNNEIVKDKYVRYNGFNDQFLGLSASDLKQISYNSELIKEVAISVPGSKDSIYFKPMRIKPKLAIDSISVFMNVLVEGQISLYAYRKYMEQVDNFNVYPTFEYFLTKQDKTTTRFNLTRYSFISQFPVQKRQIRKLIRENKLDLSIEKDLVILIQILNQTI